LTFFGGQVISFADFVATYPQGQVLKPPETQRSYGRNPYVHYDRGVPFLFDGDLDPRLPPTERIIGFELGSEVKAYSFTALAAAGEVNEEVGGAAVVILHKLGTASALDAADISAGREIGSTWSILGQATAGELAGQQLERLLAFDPFWFAWSAFFPTTGLYESP
jgi:hypothetical protein